MSDSAIWKYTLDVTLTPVPEPDFQALFESAPGLYLVLSPDLQIVGVSQAYLNATLTRREDILGRGIFDVFPDNPSDFSATGVRNLRESLERVLDTRQPDAMAVQKYDIRKPGSDEFEERFWSPKNFPVTRSDGQLAYIIHRVEDVTEFIRLRKSQQEEADRMEGEIFYRAQEVAEANRQLRQVNDDLRQMYRSISELVGGADEAASTSIAPDQMLTRVGDMIRTHQLTEEQLRHSQKMEAVGRLAGGLAHDFNNLLTVMSGSASLAMEELAGARPSNLISEIQQAADRAAALTRQLLTFSRKQVVQARVLEMNTVIRDIQTLLQRLLGDRISMSIALEEKIGNIKADRSHLEQVIVNLVANARDAMPDGGQLLLQTRSVTVPPETATGLKDGTYVRLRVSDSGAGIEPQTVARIFEPFFTTKEVGKGTGLGLATVLGIVQQCEGAINVQSEPGSGATFDVYFPATSEALPKTTSPVSQQEAHRTTVLLVEDEPAVRNLVAQILRGAGYRVLLAGCGSEALRLLDQYHGEIGLLISDIVMTGMKGPELVQRIRATSPNLAVLFMSGYDQELVIRSSLDDTTGFLPKPFTPQNLQAKIMELLNARANSSRR